MTRSKDEFPRKRTVSWSLLEKSQSPQYPEKMMNLSSSALGSVSAERCVREVSFPFADGSLMRKAPPTADCVQDQ